MFVILLSTFFTGCFGSLASSIGIATSNQYAYGENTGWINAGPTNHEVTIHYYEGTGGWLAGYAWGENVGWIVMGSGGGPYANTSSTNWGVNLAANGDLSGYAWGENVGWINFGHAQCDAAINPVNGEFTGHAWGENIGWLKFKGTSPDFGLRTLAFDTQSQGTPNWWLDYHGVNENSDAGDGVAAWRKYVMDVDPNIAGNELRITSITNGPAARSVVFSPSSSRRFYTLARRENLATGTWNNVVGQTGQAGTGGSQSMLDTNMASQAFYSLNVTVTP